MAGNIVLDSQIWSRLRDELIEEIFHWLPIDVVARLRVMSKVWNNCLSGEKFLTCWRENFKDHRWLLITEKIPTVRYCYRLNVATRTLKIFRIEPVVLTSVGGLVVGYDTDRLVLIFYNPLTRNDIQIPYRAINANDSCVIVCNPLGENFYDLPVTRLDRDHGIAVGDILWQPNQYHLLSVHGGSVEVYNFANQSWNIMHLGPSIFGNVVYFKGLFFCIVHVFEGCPWDLLVFDIGNGDSRLVCNQPKHHFPLIDPHLVVCGSALILITQDSLQLCLWELEHHDNFERFSVLPWDWKKIGEMPLRELIFLFSDMDMDILVKPFIYKFLVAGNNICFVREDTGNLVFFNKENHSWSHFSAGDEIENLGNGLNAYAFEPWPDVSIP